MKVCETCGALASDNVAVCPSDGEASWRALPTIAPPEASVQKQAPPVPDYGAANAYRGRRGNR